MISPGRTIGVLGGGPIGRLLAQASQSLGYAVHVFEPAGRSVAGAVSNRETNAPYEDLGALKEFARQVDVVTCAFENIPAEPLHAIAPLVPVLPKVEILHVCQNRQREKAWLRANGFPQVRHAEALDGDIEFVIAQVGRPCVVKTADFDSDGRGQMKITDDADLEKASAIFRGRRCVLERWVDFSCELSVIVARSLTGEVRTFPLAENIHTRQILDVSIVPARISPAIARDAEQLAISIAEKLGLVGLLAVELFVTPGGELLVNGLAPRPHNSGHGTIEGCETSQFEQLVRVVCGLPLGSIAVRQPTVMVNILGDAWRWHEGHVVGEPHWAAVLNRSDAKLHLYGIAEPRPGRKMGHFTVRAESIDVAMEHAREIKLGLHRARG